MLRYVHIVVVALVAVSCYFLSSERTLRRDDAVPHFAKGNGNGKVLFVTESSNGLSNVHLATCFALLEKHPAINVHYASSPKLEPEVTRISSTAIAKNAAAKPIIWHELLGIDHAAAINREFNGFAGLIGPPGISGLPTLMSYAAPGLVPYTADEYWNKYQQIVNLIEELDPAIIVLDNFFRPAMDAARNLNRSRAVISPNAMSDTFIGVQPKGGLFWKFPAITSGLPYPIPWNQVLSNIYQRFRLIFHILTSSQLSVKRQSLIEKGVKNPINLFDSQAPDVPWIVSSFPEGEIPLDTIPNHVMPCGPIVLDTASLELQDGQLANWLREGPPTVLINLGSGLKYTSSMAQTMTAALLPVFEATEVQVLWKFRKASVYNDDFLKPVQKYIESGRLRLEDWLKIDPVSMLRAGYITLSVHHGGANCYSEALLAGVPQVVLPHWADCYHFATMAEYLGVGVWPGKESAPVWDSVTLKRGFLKALTGEGSLDMRQKATELGKIARQYGGRDAAAEIIAELALP